MASNPYVNKVALADGTTLIDLTGDTIDADKVLYGYTAHDKSGAPITGSVGNGTITNNTSGGTSSGTINRGSQIKIGKGYYASDAYYTAQDNYGTKEITAAGTISVNGYLYVSVAAGEITQGLTPGVAITEIPRGGIRTVNPGFYANKIQFQAQSNYGTKEITSSGTTSVDGYANASVAAGSTTQNAPTVNTSTGVVTATADVTAGYQAADTKSNTLQLSTQSGTTVTPTRSEQTAVAAGKYTLGAVKVAAIPANYYTLQEVYPVNSLWATYDGTARPSSVLGFGTWTRVSPIKPTWNRLKQTTTWADMQVDAPTVYVWKRTA